MKDVKVKIPNECRYFGPDVFVIKEESSAGSKYIRNQPEIFVEILSKQTRKYDTIDKFINYQKFDSLQYYTLVEPNFSSISVYSRSNDGSDWEMECYTDKEGMIPLPYLISA